MLNAWHTEKIVPSRRYQFSKIEDEIGISRDTLTRWRKSGRLIVISTNKSFCTGQRLIEAIDNRLVDVGRW
jgi:hypothetical protein